MKSLKVSVIVPMYKVENYLERCLDSILNQTYKDLEIILVNDGSPDRCGMIAEEYAKLDNRIKVIHKKNGGLSDARNAGMEIMTGYYTMFVDSDDWLKYSMIEELLNMGLEFGADVVQSAFYYAYEDHFLYDNRYYQIEHPPILLDNQSLMAELVINERVKNFAWGKLYKTELIKDLPFKKGVLFEDVFWAHHVMQRVNSYVIHHKPLYYYLQRTDSIVATYTTRNLDFITGLKERHYFIKQYYRHLEMESLRGILKMSLIHYNLLLANREKDKGAFHRREIQHYLKAHYKILKKSVSHDFLLKSQLTLFSVHPLLNVGFLFSVKLMRKARLLSDQPGLMRIERRTPYHIRLPFLNKFGKGSSSLKI